METLRDILNRARWRDAGLHALEIHVLHRGAPGDRRVIAGSRIAAVRSGGIDLLPESDEGDSVFVPYHRFLAIVGPDGVTVWSKDGDVPPPAITPVEVAPASDAARAEEEVHPSFSVVLGDDPLTIDGSVGEGGGQMLRSSLALSIATGKPFIIDKIRAKRDKPGLLRQHLTSVRAAALVSGAEIEGLALGSTRLAFRPGAFASGEHTIEIGSAGSVGLVLQTIAYACALAPAPCRITVRGGTHALWAPPFPFLAEAWLPLVRRAGAQIDLELRSAGFHPAGGGEIVMTTTPVEKLLPLHLGPSSVIAPLELHAIVSSLPESIARRELSAAAEELKGSKVTLSSATVRSAGPGNAMWLVARDEATGIANVFSGIGDVGVRAETIGIDVARAFTAWQASGSSVETHLADQIMLPIALAGAGSFTTNELSLHAQTHLEIIHAFTGRRFRVWRGKRQVGVYRLVLG
jgi:RNA 3'-terminal phosphate cyclase (ATP)